MKSELLIRTLKMAEAVQVPVALICEDANVTPRWYYKLVRGEIPDPGVNRIQRLHDTLKKYKRR